MLAFKKIRVRDISKFHTQLSIALLGMLLVFVTGIDRTEQLGSCVCVSVLIHYFTLAAVMWMGAEAVLMFQKLVIVFVQITKRYIIIVSLICWLVPIVPVVIPLSFDPHFMVTLPEDQSNSTCIAGPRPENQFCFIGEPAVFFGAFLAPILTIVLFNCIIFGLIGKVIVQHTFKKVGSTKHMSTKDAMQLLISIVAIMVLFGFTWVFGAFTISGASTTFQYLFSIFNSMQGFFIFVFFCVVPHDSRESWIHLLFCCKKVRQRLLSSSTTSRSRQMYKGTYREGTSSTARATAMTRLSVQSSLMNLHSSSGDHSSTLSGHEHRVSLAMISEVEGEGNAIEMRPMASIISDHSLESQSEVRVNPAPLEPITESEGEGNYEEKQYKSQLGIAGEQNLNRENVFVEKFSPNQNCRLSEEETLPQQSAEDASNGWEAGAVFVNPQADDLTTGILQSDINEELDVEDGTQKDTEHQDQASPQLGTNWSSVAPCSDGEKPTVAEATSDDLVSNHHTQENDQASSNDISNIL